MKNKTKQTEQMETHARVQNNLRWAHNFKLKPSDMEVNSGISKTVPNETYTIKELVMRFSKGMDPQISRVGEFDEEQDFHSIKNMDFDEVHELQQNTRERIAELNQKLSGGTGDVPPQINQKNQNQNQQKQNQKTSQDAPAESE